MTDKVKEHVSTLQTDMALIPGGLTSHLQPADVSWNKPFKAAYRELYNQWMSSGNKSYTAAGNMRAPDKSLCLDWVKQAWSSVTTEVIVNSFLVCGISSNTDGSQDGQIHSLKPGQVAHSAADTIEKETARLNLATSVEADDPFADLDEEEDEECMIDDE